ncbi:MAG: LAGLIDADG family homing endonuclease [Patescibacteria group bacterium]|nr:LAGLIDADG family homing endonuclease [Patescibacteria group bacterium]
MRRNQKNKDYKAKWSSELAYLVGLITTDGSLSVDGRHLNITSNNIQLLEAVKNV